MAEQNTLLAAMEQRGEAAGRALAEQDYHVSDKPERTRELAALHDNAWEAARQAMQRTVVPYGDDAQAVEEAFANAFLDAYIVRLGELTHAGK